MKGLLRCGHANLAVYPSQKRDVSSEWVLHTVVGVQSEERDAGKLQSAARILIRVGVFQGAFLWSACYLLIFQDWLSVGCSDQFGQYIFYLLIVHPVPRQTEEHLFEKLVWLARADVAGF